MSRSYPQTGDTPARRLRRRRSAEVEQMEVEPEPAAPTLKDLVDVHDVVAAFKRNKKPGRRTQKGLRWDFYFRLPNGDGTLHKRGTTMSGWKLLAGEEATGVWREGAVLYLESWIGEAIASEADA